ncbi:hypothetical protein I4U23_028496 [Adineta vaga]|nr:hypothetical protein I4U23_028496 [Adineta vaga]
MPSFTREFVSCHAKSFESHLYNDPVMLSCSHVFCRSCCFDLARMSQDQYVICPICSTRIPFDNVNRFAINLISHGTLATMVKQYLREESLHPICYSCQNNNVNNETKNLNVGKEIKRLNEEADRQLRLLKHRADIVPVFCPSTMKPSAHMFGELLFKYKDPESKSPKLSTNQSMINTSGDTSLQSIPSKLPMWTVIVNALPTHLCVYPVVTYDSPRYIRTFHLFPEQSRIYVQSFAVFNRFMLVHIREKDHQDSLYFFTHDGILEYGPIQLSNLIRQYLADENRLWAIDSMTQTIFFHAQPLFTHEISTILSKHEQFISFDEQSNFIPFRIAINHQLLAILSKDLQQVYIYNKISRERIFVSHFTAGMSTNIWDIGLFPRDNSLLLKFDCSFEGNVKRSLFIHFNTKNQSVGRIEGKHCLGVVIGPNKEILIGFNLRTGIIRCYM